MNLLDILRKIKEINAKLSLIETYQDNSVTVLEIVTEIREEIKNAIDMIEEQKDIQNQLKHIAFDLANKL